VIVSIGSTLDHRRILRFGRWSDGTDPARRAQIR
jgi:hypothetical protein